MRGYGLHSLCTTTLEGKERGKKKGGERAVDLAMEIFFAGGKVEESCACLCFSVQRAGAAEGRRKKKGQRGEEREGGKKARGSRSLISTCCPCGRRGKLREKRRRRGGKKRGGVSVYPHRALGKKGEGKEKKKVGALDDPRRPHHSVFRACIQGKGKSPEERKKGEEIPEGG